MEQITGPMDQLYRDFLLSLPKLAAALVIFFLALYLSGLAWKTVKRALEARQVDSEVVLLVSRLTRWAVVTIGLVVALGQVNFDLTGFMAGLGIVGFTVGLAVQDVSKNFVSGVLLLMQQPFNIGDTIEIHGYTGTVTDISTRATVLKTFDGLTIAIPNADVYTAIIKHYGNVGQRRLQVSVGVAYDADLDRVTRTVVEALRQTPGVDDGELAPSVLFDGFGESSVDLTAYFWINLAEVNYTQGMNQGFKAIKLALEQAGIEIPYPTRRILTPGSDAKAASSSEA